MKTFCGFLIVAGLALALYSLRGDAADYVYTVTWVNAAQPPGVVLTGSRVAWYPCAQGPPANSVTVPAPALVATVTLPMDRYCWTVYALAGALESEPSAITVWHTATDTDGDGVRDDTDNCTLLPNPNQADSDADGFGNRCDGDLNGNGFTNSQDYVLFRAQLGQPSPAPVYNPADFNTNGFVNAQDYVLFQQLLGAPPGPRAP